MKTKTSTIYCISGLGANETAFSKLKIAGYNLKIIAWLQPLENETLQGYAARMRTEIIEPNPIIMGLSFGGIMCIEIAKQIDVKKIIIISSVKSTSEMPFWMKAVGKFKLNKIAPITSNYNFAKTIQNHFLGISTDEEKSAVAAARKRTNTVYMKWSVDKVLNWKNDWHHPQIFHIHGDKDKMFPIKTINANFTIKNGGHYMILNRADEVSHFVNLCLQQ